MKTLRMGLLIFTGWAMFAAVTARADDFHFSAPTGFRIVEKTEGRELWRDEARPDRTWIITQDDVEELVPLEIELRQNFVELSLARARALAPFGITEYRTRSITLEKGGQGYVLAVRSEFVGISGRSVQMYARENYLGRRRIIIAYGEEGTDLSDPRGIERQMGRLKVDDRAPSSAAKVESSVLITCENCRPGHADRLIKSAKDIAASAGTPHGKDVCDAVEESKLRHGDALNETNFAGEALNCAEGFAEGLGDMIKGSYEAVLDVGKFIFLPKYRAHVSAGVVAVYREFTSDRIGFIRKITHSLIESLKIGSEQFFWCLNDRAQDEIVCRFLSYLSPKLMGEILLGGTRAISSVPEIRGALEKAGAFVLKPHLGPVEKAAFTERLNQDPALKKEYARLANAFEGPGKNSNLQDSLGPRLVRRVQSSIATLGPDETINVAMVNHAVRLATDPKAPPAGRARALQNLRVYDETLRRVNGQPGQTLRAKIDNFMTYVMAKTNGVSKGDVQKVTGCLVASKGLALRLRRDPGSCWSPSAGPVEAIVSN